MKGKLSLDRMRGWLENTEREPEDPFLPEENAASEENAAHNPEEYAGSREIRAFSKLYNIFSVVFCVILIFVLMTVVSWLPPTGAVDNPASNEVSERYIEDGLEETGAVNIVAGMILDYRAFDTFGESCVLFTAVSCVFILLKVNKRTSDMENDRIYEPKNDEIIQLGATLLVPIGLLVGIYVILNGHLSAGGGFSGGAVLGACLILYVLAFGFRQVGRFFTERTFKIVTVIPLTFYCLAKSYAFFTGANGLESHIPLGTPGAILSSGLILPLNICVGMVVACTMYAFYCMFRKGSF